MPAIRSAPSARDTYSTDESRLRLFLRLTTVTLREDAPADFADLVERVKCRAARARIPYDGDVIHAAVRRLERDRRLVFASRHQQASQPRADVRPLTRAESRAILDELGARALAKTFPELQKRGLPTGAL